MMKFAIVLLEDDLVNIIPSDWIIGSKNLCLYPNVGAVKCHKWTPSREEPRKDWKVMKIKVLHNCESVESAKEYLRSLSFDSSMYNSVFKSKKRKKQLPGETSSSDEETHPKEKLMKMTCSPPSSETPEAWRETPIPTNEAVQSHKTTDETEETETTVATATAQHLPNLKDETEQSSLTVENSSDQSPLKITIHSIKSITPLKFKYHTPLTQPVTIRNVKTTKIPTNQTAQVTREPADIVELPPPLTNPHLQTPTTYEDPVQKAQFKSTFMKNTQPPIQSFFEYVSADSLDEKPPASPSSQPCSGGSSQESFVTKELLSLKRSQEKMWKMMEGFSEKLDSILALLTKMEAEKKVENSTKSFGSYPDLPIKKDKFMDFEERLQDPTFRSNFGRVLWFSGGTNLRSFTYNVMRSLISDELAEEYSLTRKNSQAKKSFVSTKTFKLVLGVCRRKFEDGNASTVRDAISKFLSQAKNRRIKRERKKAELRKKLQDSTDDFLYESERSRSSFLNESDDETL